MEEELLKILVNQFGLPQLSAENLVNSLVARTKESSIENLETLRIATVELIQDMILQKE